MSFSHKIIKGLYYIPNVINPTFTNSIIQQLDSNVWKSIRYSHSRKVQQYGYVFNFETKETNEPGPEFTPLISKFAILLQEICKTINITKEPGYFNQCIVNNYEPGQGFLKHIDTLTYGDTIGCFTINTGAIIKFSKDDLFYNLYTEPNSLYIMTGESRYDWYHEMPNTTFDIDNDTIVERGRRLSITFRNVSL